MTAIVFPFFNLALDSKLYRLITGDTQHGAKSAHGRSWQVWKLYQGNPGHHRNKATQQRATNKKTCGDRFTTGQHFTDDNQRADYKKRNDAFSPSVMWLLPEVYGFCYGG